MQTIDVNYSNGVGPFTIYVCNISLDYCGLIATNVILCYCQDLIEIHNICFKHMYNSCLL